MAIISDMEPISLSFSAEMWAHTDEASSTEKHLVPLFDFKMKTVESSTAD